MSEIFASELEKKNLEVHVDMSLQRYIALAEKVEAMEIRLDKLIAELVDFRKEHAALMNKMREENAVNVNGTHKLFVGAAATVIGGLLSTVMVLLIAFM
jgi:hypothetical protein